MILTTRDSDFADELRYPPGSNPGIIVLRIHPSLPRVMAERLAFMLDNVKELGGRITIVLNRNYWEIAITFNDIIGLLWACGYLNPGPPPCENATLFITVYQRYARNQNR